MPIGIVPPKLVTFIVSESNVYKSPEFKNRQSKELVSTCVISPMYLAVSLANEHSIKSFSCINRFSIGYFISACRRFRKRFIYPFAGSPGVHEENNCHPTINASLSVDTSKVHPIGSDPKQSNLISPVCCGRMIKDLFPPRFELIDKVVPSTFTFFTWKCITWPPW